MALSGELMIETPPSQIEGPRVGDAPPLVALVGSLAPVALATLVTEAVHLTETMMTMDSEPRLEGVHVTDVPPIVSLTGAVVTPPLARLIPRERLRVVDRPVRIRRQRLPP